MLDAKLKNIMVNFGKKREIHNIGSNMISSMGKSQSSFPELFILLTA
jgi:hypothetical protein